MTAIGGNAGLRFALNPKLKFERRVRKKLAGSNGLEAVSQHNDDTESRINFRTQFQSP
jgi:hypothetical protein